MGPKRNLTLDLNTPAAGKRLRSGTTPAAGSAAVLTSPDVQRLRLNSPQLREFLTSNVSGATPTPSGYSFPAQTEQEMLVKQFDQAMKKGGTESNAAGGGHLTRAAKQMSGGGALLLPSTIAETVASGSAASESTANNVEIKEEPEADEELTPPGGQQKGKGKGSSGSRSTKRNAGSVASNSASESEASFAPIDMDCQEQIKLDRKRQRNRLAATKCRKKKLEKIAKLEDKVNELKGENSDLGAVLKRLKENVSNLKVEVMEHVNNGCQIDMS